MVRHTPAVAVHDAARLGAVAAHVRVVVETEVVAHLVSERRRDWSGQRVVILKQCQTLTTTSLFTPPANCIEDISQC